MKMDSFMYIAFLIQMYYSVVLCKAENAICGISESGSFKASFDEAVKHLSNISSDRFIQLNSNQSLKQILETGVTLTSALQQHSLGNVFLFTDLNNQLNGILREVVDFQSRNKASANITIQLDNPFSSQSKVKIISYRHPQVSETIK